MSIMNTFKKGATNISKKTKDTVEINRLKMQNSSKEKEIKELYFEIGKIAYQKHIEEANVTFSENELTLFFQIDTLQHEINETELEIARLNGKKLCQSCGEYVINDIKFCSSCGANFSDFDEPTSNNEEVAATAPNNDLICPNEECQAPVINEAKFCGECGTDLTKLWE
ncbi:zinc ribbon domain-containing protein [Salirhabdus salicampi]|uniref:zinc ribbon domain-containing protein n=1 Tax=Salirhabdus salicampi TaxID=476102 RepID=UPI0020C540BD|nr:zinc ribbon domain-containing protein [Salirhabdus salicampi]MCP8617281.1 zinc ribbon domain-containing protein [Salirhabdus salicampi]